MASAANHCVPETCEVLSEVLQGALIARHCEVAEVSFHDSPQPGPHHFDREVHPLAQLHLDPFQLGVHSLLLRLPSDLESSISGLPAEVRESKEVERLRSSQSRPPAPFGGEPPAYVRLHSLTQASKT